MYDSSRSKTSKRSSQAKQFEMLKRLNKEKLQQYKDSLDKKIKELREKIESSSSLQTTLSFKQGNCGANYYSSNNDRKHKGDFSGNQSKKMLISNLKGNVSSAFSVGTLAGGDKREMFFVGNDEKKGSLNDVISSRPNNPQNNSPKSIQTIINNYDYCSIKEIQSPKKIHLNYKDFYHNVVLRSNKILYGFLDLLGSDSIKSILLINRDINNIIKNSIVNRVKSSIIDDFKLKFLKKYNVFSRVKFKIIPKKYYKNDIENIRLVLNIEATVSENNSNIIGKTLKLSYEDIDKSDKNNRGNPRINSFLLQIKPPHSPKKFWVYKEYTSFHYDDSNKAYFNDVMQFAPKDVVSLNINIFTALGLVDFENFKWLKPKFLRKKNDFFLFSFGKIIADFEGGGNTCGNFNGCEAEKLVKIWTGIETLDKCEIVVSNLNQYFSRFFKINQIYYDDIGFYIFKINLTANQPGVFYQEDQNSFGIKINIFEKGTSVKNESKKNGLIIDEVNELNINIGDELTFYISQNKDVVSV